MDNIKERLALIELIYSYYITQCIKVAAQLKIPDVLDESSKSYQEIASETQSHPEAIWRMLRLLKRVGKGSLRKLRRVFLEILNFQAFLKVILKALYVL